MASDGIQANIQIDVQVDATGLRCPLPLLKAKKALNEMVVGAVLELRATDPGSERDFKVFCTQSAHQMLHYEKAADVYIYQIKKGA